MNNLYIVNTPLHMLTAYILANSITAGMNNHLLLINPKRYPSWEKSKCLAKMSNDSDTWARTTVVDKRYLKQDIKNKGLKNLLNEYRAKLLAAGTIDQVYLASDKILGNQLAVELSGNTTYIRFDEGSSSYYFKKRKWISKISELILIKILHYIANLKSCMVYNFDSIGAGKGGTADYLYQPQLLERFSPKPIKIEKEAIAKSLKRLTPVMQEYEALAEGKVVLYLGQYLAEYGVVDSNKELQLLLAIKEITEARNMKFLYKPHPGERSEKLEKYAQEVPTMQFFNSVEPIEIILHKYSTIKSVISFSSSAMIYAELFSQNKNLFLISTLCLLALNAAALQSYSTMRINMEKTGVKIPETMDELQKYFLILDNDKL